MPPEEDHDQDGDYHDRHAHQHGSGADKGGDRQPGGARATLLLPFLRFVGRRETAGEHCEPPGAKFAALFPAGQLVVQPGAGHFPWLDDADRFVSAVTAFLDDGL